jgi:hypothetical protein
MRTVLGVRSWECEGLKKKYLGLLEKLNDGEEISEKKKQALFSMCNIQKEVTSNKLYMLEVAKFFNALEELLKAEEEQGNG